MGFLTRFLNGAFQEIKAKLNRSRQLNSAEKNLKEDWQLIETFQQPKKKKKKGKKKKNTQIQRTLKHFYETKNEKKNTQIQRTFFPGHSLR